MPVNSQEKSYAVVGSSSGTRVCTSTLAFFYESRKKQGKGGQLVLCGTSIDWTSQYFCSHWYPTALFTNKKKFIYYLLTVKWPSKMFFGICQDHFLLWVRCVLTWKWVLFFPISIYLILGSPVFIMVIIYTIMKIYLIL